MPDRGEVLLLPFPFTDLSAAKRRPVLALTATDEYGVFIALPITSRPQTAHALPLTPADLSNGMLPAPSWIRTNRVVTLNESLVRKTLARVSPALVTRAVEELCAISAAQRFKASGRDRLRRWMLILTGLQVQVGAICPEPRLRPGTAPGEYH